MHRLFWRSLFAREADREPQNMRLPNPRLQRTPSASPPSPLSRQPLGRPESRHGTRLFNATSSRLVVSAWRRARSFVHRGREGADRVGSCLGSPVSPSIRQRGGPGVANSSDRCEARHLESWWGRPNTSLHRTPAAAPPSPVSSKPLGHRKTKHG